MAGIAGVGKADQLETEVKILQSPSVLKPVFDFVRASKRSAGEDVDQMRYEQWVKGNLDIKLEKGTSVLNLSYRDTKKDFGSAGYKADFAGLPSLFWARSRARIGEWSILFKPANCLLQRQKSCFFACRPAVRH
jgi:hypothetical protein